MIVEETPPKGVIRRIKQREISDLPKGEVLIKVHYSSLNYTVGGEQLTWALKTTRRDGVVTCCGNIASADLHVSIYPFILRGISLMGINSANTGMPLRKIIWNNFAGSWKLPHLETLSETIRLDDLNLHIDRMLNGVHTGRSVIDLNLA